MVLRFVIVSILAWGCNGLSANERPVREIAVTEIDAGSQCGSPDRPPGVEWITRSEQNETLRKSALKDLTSYTWDPATEGLLLIHMGTRPTGGYRLELGSPTAQVRSAAAVIRVNWLVPEPGGFVTQALTAPCLLLKIPKTDVEKIIVLDQDEKMRFEIPTRN
jgi:hypothetical protein